MPFLQVNSSKITRKQPMHTAWIIIILCLVFIPFVCAQQITTNSTLGVAFQSLTGHVDFSTVGDTKRFTYYIVPANSPIVSICSLAVDCANFAKTDFSNFQKSLYCTYCLNTEVRSETDYYAFHKWLTNVSSIATFESCGGVENVC